MIAGYRRGGIVFCLKSAEWKEGIGSSPRINAKEKRPFQRFFNFLWALFGESPLTPLKRAS